jgi:hypothetical protein
MYESIKFIFQMYTILVGLLLVILGVHGNNHQKIKINIKQAWI